MKAGYWCLLAFLATGLPEARGNTEEPEETPVQLVSFFQDQNSEKIGFFLSGYASSRYLNEAFFVPTVGLQRNYRLRDISDWPAVTTGTPLYMEEEQYPLAFEWKWLANETKLRKVFLQKINGIFLDQTALPELEYLCILGSSLFGLELLDLPRLQTLILSHVRPLPSRAPLPGTSYISTLPEPANLFSHAPPFRLSDKLCSLQTLRLEYVTDQDFDFTSLRHVRLKNFCMMDFVVSDIDFLKEHPLETLMLKDGRKLTQLALLGDLPLQRLSLNLFYVTDYRFLTKLKLRELELDFHGDSNFSLELLRGMPLEKLTLRARGPVEIGSLQVLENMPLKELVLENIIATHRKCIDEKKLSVLSLERCTFK